MGFLSDKVSIEQYILANISSIPIVFENDEPDFSLEEWARVSIRSGTPYQGSIGNSPVYRYPGVLFFQVFIRQNIGSGRAMVIADEVTSLFRSRRLGSIVFSVPQAYSVGVNEDWYQTNISTDFYSEA